jgi:hypothetical protein
MKFDIVENSSWDLDEGYAHYLKVDFNFTVIGNDLPIYEAQSPEEESIVDINPNPVTPNPDDTSPAPKGIGGKKYDFLNPLPFNNPSDYLGPGGGFERANPLIDINRGFNGFGGGTFGGGGANGIF